MEQACGGLLWIADLRGVVAPSDLLVGAYQRVLSPRVVIGGDCGGQERANRRSRIKAGERRPQPLAVRGVGAFKEETQPHEVARDPSGHHPRPEVVASLGRPSHKRLLLRDPGPLGSQQQSQMSCGYQASDSRIGSAHCPPVVRSIAKRAGLGQVHPHMLRAAFIMCALEAGVPLREVQIAARHADPRTTTVYDHRRQSFDRHAAYVAVAFVAGGSSDHPLIRSHCSE